MDDPAIIAMRLLRDANSTRANTNTQQERIKFPSRTGAVRSSKNVPNTEEQEDEKDRPLGSKDESVVKESGAHDTAVDMTEFGTKEAQDGNEKRELSDKDPDAASKLGFAFSTFKKWRILTVIFVVQISMNFNASVYANAVEGMSEQFGISAQGARWGQLIFLIAYAFGCELWAPWSEELGRKWILQASLGLVNLWQIPCALAPNYGTILGFRFLGGLSSAGGSVTLGLIADMWPPRDQQYAVAYIVLSSVGGSVVGPIVGGFVQTYLSWRWIFWIQLIFGGVTQILHLWLVPETRATVLLDKEAERRRKTGEDPNIWGPCSIEGTLTQRMSIKHITSVWIRPFVFLATEPIVLCLSLLSGFSDALIFTFLESYGLVFKQWNFTAIQLGLAFIPLLIGYIIAYLLFLWPIRTQQAYMRKAGYNNMRPERRLYALLWMAPLLPIGLIAFAWTSLGPPIPWIAPLIFSVLVGIANYAIYMATIDYMVAAYGEYSASATGGNGFARDFFAGVSALYAVPLYEAIPGRYTLEWPSTILAFISAIFIIPLYVFYKKGEWFRARSKYAEELNEIQPDATDDKEFDGRRQSVLPSSRRQSVVGSPTVSPDQSRINTPSQSAVNSPKNSVDADFLGHRTRNQHVAVASRGPSRTNSSTVIPPIREDDV